MQKLKMIPCPKCGNPFPELRKTKFGYHVCVDCSTVEPVVGITTVEGSGDHTYNDIIIMDRRKAVAIAKKEAELSGKSSHSALELLDLDKDEDKVNEKLSSKMQAIMDEDINTDTIVTDDSPPNEDMDTDGMIKGIDY